MGVKTKKEIVVPPKPKTGKNGKHPGGRPTKYREEYAHQAFVFACQDAGLTNVVLAKLFQVNIDSIYEWKKVHPGFSDALKLGAEELDKRVEKSLYERARGYEHSEEKVFCNALGEVTKVATIKHYPPDPTSMIFWLKNRDKDRWRDKHDIDHTGTIQLAPAKIDKAEDAGK